VKDEALGCTSVDTSKAAVQSLPRNCDIATAITGLSFQSKHLHVHGTLAGPGYFRWRLSQLSGPRSPGPGRAALSDMQSTSTAVERGRQSHWMTFAQCLHIYVCA